MTSLKKSFIYLCLALMFVFNIGINVGETYAIEYKPEVQTKASILIDMDSNKVLYEHDATAQMPVASIVKLMTIMLTFEHIDNGSISLDDKVMVNII